MTPTGPDFSAHPGGRSGRPEPCGFPGDAATAADGLPRRGIVIPDAGRARAASPGPWAADEAVEQALAAAAKDGDRVNDLLEVLSRGRLWLPLPSDDGPVTDGSAIQLPTVVYLGAEFVPAFTSAARLVSSAPGAPAGPDDTYQSGWSATTGPYPGWAADRVPRAAATPRPSVPHVVVPAAELARRLPPGLGIALNPGAQASVPIYPEGVTYLAAAEWTAGDARIRLGQPPVEPEGLLREVSASLRPIPAARAASRAWLSVPGAGEGLIISVTLDDPADTVSQDAVLGAVEYAAGAAGLAVQFPIDVVFPGEYEPDDVDRWIADHAMPFHLRA